MSKWSSNKKDQLIFEGWRSFVNEQDEQPAPQDTPETAPAGTPQAEPQPEEPTAGALPSITEQTSFKELKNPATALATMNELLKGGDLFKQLNAGQGKFPTPLEKLKAWVASTGGPEVFAKRAAAIGAKIPEQGLAKKDMPFLPGPDDAQGKVSDVEDALSPGGEYNIDMMERIKPPPPNQFVGMNPDGTGQAADFMKSGFNDGKPNDDNLKIVLNGEFPAAEAIPTQTNILLPKALGMAVAGIAGGDFGAYASTKGHILDGHHRWAATMLNKPEAKIGTFAMIDTDRLGMVPTLQYLTAIGNALGNKTKTK